MQVHTHFNRVALFCIHENGEVGISDRSDLNQTVENVRVSSECEIGENINTFAHMSSSTRDTHPDMCKIIVIII